MNRSAPLRLPFARNVLVLLACATASFALVPNGRSQAIWSLGRIGTAPDGMIANGVAYGNGRFVASRAGGAGPTLVWSTDAGQWHAASMNVFGLNDVLFVAGAFYAISSQGIWRSTDGVQWTQHRPLIGGVNFNRAASDGSGLMVTLVGSRELGFSPDLATWRNTAPLPNTTGVVGESVFQASVAFGGGRYFVTYLVSPPFGVLNAYCASTLDGATWTVVSAFDSANIAGGNGRLVAIAGPRIWTTTNGTSFTDVPSPAIVQSQTHSQVTFGGGRFFLARNLISSVDGVNWAAMAPLAAPNATFAAVTYGNGRYVAAGANFDPATRINSDLVAVLPAAGPPVFARHPEGRTLVAGEPLTLEATLENPDAMTTLQWRRDGAPIPGATLPRLVIAAVELSDSARYTLEARNAIGTATSAPALLTVVPASEAGRILNLSVLTSIDASSGPEANFTVGFVVGGTGTSGGKALLVRAGGPSLARFGAAHPNPDPRIELFAGRIKIADNDNWGGGALLSGAMTAVGAFAFLGPDSRDAAIFHTGVAPGDSSVRVFGASGATGAVIAEIYDATPREAFTATTSRLINVSVLKPLPAGLSLRAGFVTGGSIPKTVLIRAIGPGLAGLGVGNVLADPRLALFRSGVPAAIMTNDDWGGVAALKAAFTSTGAFGLADASRDAALLITLPPGEYVAEAAGAGASAGMVLVEIYEVP